jgi:hypothetical protein
MGGQPVPQQGGLLAAKEPPQLGEHLDQAVGVVAARPEAQLGATAPYPVADLCRGCALDQCRPQGTTLLQPRRDLRHVPLEYASGVRIKFDEMRSMPTQVVLTAGVDGLDPIVSVFGFEGRRIVTVSDYSSMEAADQALVGRGWPPAGP